MPGFLGFVAEQYTRLPLIDPPADVEKGTYIITGANTGLGYECAKHLIEFGAARVIIAIRSLEKGNAALARLRKETGRASAGEVWELDLASLDSVEKFVKRINSLDRIDAIIENAGVALLEFTKVDDIEMSLMVNVLATMLLAFRVLPKLKESAKRFNIQPRLVIVSSGTGLYPMLKGKLDDVEGNVFQTLSGPGMMGWRYKLLFLLNPTKVPFCTRAQSLTIWADRYPLTKQMEIYAVRQLASLLPASKTGVIVNALNPGFCMTELSRHVGGLLWVRMRLMKAFLARSAEAGSRTLLHAAVAGPESHGCYMSNCAVAE